MAKTDSSAPTELIPTPWTVHQASSLFVASLYGRLPIERFFCWVVRLGIFVRLFGDRSLEDVTSADLDHFLDCHKDDF